MYEFISAMLDIFRILFLGSNSEITHTITLCLTTVLAQAVFLLAQIASNYSNWPRLLYVCIFTSTLLNCSLPNQVSVAAIISAWVVGSP